MIEYLLHSQEYLQGYISQIESKIQEAVQVRPGFSDFKRSTHHRVTQIQGFKIGVYSELNKIDKTLYYMPLQVNRSDCKNGGPYGIWTTPYRPANHRAEHGTFEKFKK